MASEAAVHVMATKAAAHAAEHRNDAMVQSAEANPHANSLKYLAEMKDHKLPPKEERLFEGVMSKKVLSSKGASWQHRHAILSTDYLTFCKRDNAHQQRDQIPQLVVSVDQLWDVFEKQDSDLDGSLDYDQTAAALKQLNKFTSHEDCTRMFEAIDLDGSGRLTWEEFKLLNQRLESRSSILDYIPLHEIVSIDFEIHASEISESLELNSPAANQSAAHSTLRRSSVSMASRSITNSLRKFVDHYMGLEMGEKGILNLTLPPFDRQSETVHIIIETVQGGVNSGKVYLFGLPHDTAQDWLDNLTHFVRLAKKSSDMEEMRERFGNSSWSMLRARAYQYYHSSTFQCIIAMFIIMGFLLDMLEAQYELNEGSWKKDLMYRLDILVTSIFTVELLVNILAHSDNCFRPFYSRLANWFDTLIVVVSVYSVAYSMFKSAAGNWPDAKLFRLMRVVRVVRLFSRLKRLNKIIKSISYAVAPVCNAFLILLIISAVYAILATSVFKARAPEYFGNFQRSLFTMFQILTGDSWASGVARSIFVPEGSTEASVALFFVSYVLIANVVLMNVVVAVLLDEFISSVTREKEEKEYHAALERDKRRVSGCLDPLTRSLAIFQDESDLEARIKDIFMKLDEDDSGGITFKEFQQNVKDISTSIHLTRDEFDVISEQGRHLGPSGEFTGAQFQEMMIGELWRFSRRELANVMSVSGDEQFRSTILMLKIMELSTNSSLAKIINILQSMQAQGASGYSCAQGAGSGVGPGAVGRTQSSSNPAHVSRRHLFQRTGSFTEKLLHISNPKSAGAGAEASGGCGHGAISYAEGQGANTGICHANVWNGTKDCAGGVAACTQEDRAMTNDAMMIILQAHTALLNKLSSQMDALSKVPSQIGEISRALCQTKDKDLAMYAHSPLNSRSYNHDGHPATPSDSDSEPRHLIGELLASFREQDWDLLLDTTVSPDKKGQCIDSKIRHLRRTQVRVSVGGHDSCQLGPLATFSEPGMLHKRSPTRSRTRHGERLPHEWWRRPKSSPVSTTEARRSSSGGSADFCGVQTKGCYQKGGSSTGSTPHGRTSSGGESSRAVDGLVLRKGASLPPLKTSARLSNNDTADTWEDVGEEMRRKRMTRENIGASREETGSSQVTPVLPHSRIVSLASLVAVPNAIIRDRSNKRQNVWAAHELESRLRGEGRRTGKIRDIGHSDVSHLFQYSRRDEAANLNISGALFATAPASSMGSWHAIADVGGGGGPEAARAAAQMAAAAAAKAAAAAMEAKEEIRIFSRGEEKSMKWLQS